LIESARTFVFVPGDRPDRFKRADSSGDEMIIDLEDAVPAERKALARAAAEDWLGERPALVRVNSEESLLAADLHAIGRSASAIVLPKCEGPQHVERVQGLVGGAVSVVALIETAAGVLAADRIARSPGVVRLALGNVDLAADLDVAPDDSEALRAARSSLVLASAAAGLPGPIDGVTTDVRNFTRTRDDARHARRLGMTAKLCIHPAQVAAVQEAMTPDDETVAWARAVVASDTSGVAVLDGHMIDAPVAARARRVLAGLHG
jgi:citrate lyase subunit beta/citryl-CoA lyase